MQTLYQLGLLGYRFIILLISPFNTKARNWIQGRKNWKKKLNQFDNTQSWIWFHCASLGEYEDCYEVFLKLKLEFKNSKILLTVFSPSAYEVIKHNNPFDELMYLPIDTKSNARLFIQKLNPTLVVFARSEIWVNYIQTLKFKNIPIFLISLKLTHQSGFLKPILKRFYQKSFTAFQFIYSQDNQTIELLEKQFKVNNTRLTGNTRFERIFKEKQKGVHFPEIEEFKSNALTIIVGSSLPKDESIIQELIDEDIFNSIKWIIVPHEWKSSIFKHKKWTRKDTILFSQINNLNSKHRILFVDQVGILKHLYQYGEIALIGGGFNKIGIHNIIEPAIYGLQIGIGPNHRNYQEAIDLINLKACFIFKNTAELKNILEEIIQNQTPNTSQKELKDYIENQSNTSSIIQDHLLKTFNKS
jgi:3-deoxy-D-manno-octulosonic-acid transferase